MGDKETTLFLYSDSEGNLLVARSGEFAHGGQPCITRWGHSRPSSTIWGILIELSYDFSDYSRQPSGSVRSPPSGPFDNYYDQYALIPALEIPPSSVYYPTNLGLGYSAPPEPPVADLVIPLTNPAPLVAVPPLVPFSSRMDLPDVLATWDALGPLLGESAPENEIPISTVLGHLATEFSQMY